MKKQKKFLAVLSAAAVSTMIAAAVSTTAFAITTDVIAKIDGQEVKINFEELTTAYENKAAGLDSELFNKYNEREGLTALLDDINGFVDYKAVQEAAEDAVALGEKFVLNDFTENTEKTLADFKHEAEWKDGKVVPVTPVEEDLKVESVSAINANKIKVTFNQAVDTTKATFEVKRGISNVAIKDAVWNEAKTEAVLERASSNFLAGDYTVTVKGLTEEALTNEIKIEAQKVADIEITTENLVKAADGKSATFTYEVKDQYGDDITKSAEITATASKGSIALDKTKKTGKLTYDFTTTEGKDLKEVVVTLVNSATGVSTSKTLKVSDAASVATFELGEVTLPEGKTRIYADQAEAAKIAFTAKDQYGNAVKANPEGAVQLLSSDDNVATFAFAKAADGTYYIKVTTKSGLTEAKNVTLTAVVVANGSVTTKTMEVVLAPAPAAVEFGALSKDVVALGDEVYMDVVVTDQFGEVMAPKDYVGDGTAKVLGLSAAGVLKTTEVTVVNDKTDKNYGKIKLAPVEDGQKGTATLVSTLAGKTVSTNIEIKEKREVTEIAAAKDANLMQGAESQLKFTFKDQYGDDIKTDKLADTNTYTYKIKVEKVSGDAGALTLSNPADAKLVDGVLVKTGNNETELKEIKVKADDAKTGKFNVTVELLKGDSVVSSATTAVTVVKSNVEGLTYSVADIPTLNASGVEGISKDSPYAHEVKVNAKDANGNEYAINPADILSITSDHDKFNEQDGFIWFTALDKDDKTTATITVTINTLDGIETITKEVNLSKDAAKIQTLRVVDTELENATNDEKDIKDFKDVSAFDFETLAKAKEGKDINIIGQDQYGVWSSVDDATLIVNSTDLADRDAFTVSEGTLKLDTNKRVTAREDIKLTFVKDDASVQVTTKIEKGFDVTLKSLKYDDKDITLTDKAASIELEKGTTEVPEVTAVANDSKSVVTVTQATALESGDNKANEATVKVVAEDGREATYTITFTVKAD